MAKKRFYDVWFLQANTVYKEVPYSVVTDWAEGGRLQADDRIRPSGTAQWFRLGGFPELSGFLHRDEPQPTLEEIELEPLYGGFTWKRRPEDDDDDPDMIPLIDVSLVLLVFFMMTASVATVSRVLVPDTVNPTELTENPEAFWIGIDRDLDPQTNQPIPRYQLSRGTAAPPTEDRGLSLEELLARFDERIAKQTVPVEVRMAAHREINADAVDDLSDELYRRQRQGVAIRAIYAEVNEGER